MAANAEMVSKYEAKFFVSRVECYHMSVQSLTTSSWEQLNQRSNTDCSETLLDHIVVLSKVDFPVDGVNQEHKANCCTKLGQERFHGVLRTIVLKLSY
jgi:hypothetical protein